MATGRMYLTGLQKIVAGTVKLSTDSIYLMLASSSYTPNYATHASKTDVQAAEVTGTGYTAGGNLLTTSIVVNSTTYDVTLAASNVTYSTAVTARYAVVYASNAGGTHLLACVDLGSSIAVDTLDLSAGVCQFVTWTPRSPTPVGGEIYPLILASPSGSSWRTIVDSAGVLLTQLTNSDASTVSIFLQDSASVNWKLTVSDGGALTATSGSTPAATDLTYTSASPLVVPSVDPTKTYAINVGTDGTLTVAAQ